MKKTLCIFATAVMLMGLLTGCDSSVYKDANEAFAAGDYTQVITLLDTIPDYEDSENLRAQSNAIMDFQSAVDAANLANAEIDKAAEEPQALLSSEQVPYDESTATDLQLAISAFRETKIQIPDMPGEVEAIIAETERMNAPVDNASQLESMQSAQAAMEDSIRQMEQITNPTGDFVIMRLSEIDGIEEIAGVTEDNDPNGNLNKAGGYTSTTYFSSVLINQAEVYGSDLIDKGTDAGGAVEVYVTAEDAEKRNDYLAGFDGSVLSSGSHMVLGTMVIRTSDELTATQQNELTELIVAKLLELQ